MTDGYCFMSPADLSLPTFNFDLVCLTEGNENDHVASQDNRRP